MTVTENNDLQSASRLEITGLPAIALSQLSALHFALAAARQPKAARTKVSFIVVKV
jgi:hypothetical protein